MKHLVLKFLIVICYSFLIIEGINAQETSNAQVDSELSEFLPNYSTVSPTSLYNGVPDIGIPLYTLKARGISIPISLSYDASGITVHQEATSVGLGWTLNAGGHIIHETRDWFDDAGIARIDDEAKAGAKEKYYVNSTTIIEDYTPGQACDVLNEYDNLPDLFYYNCNGMSGKFILSEDLTEGIELPESTNKIERDLTTGDITMTDENGIIYKFEQQMYVGSSYIKTESLIYLLKTIYTPQQDVIEFTYQSARYRKPFYRTIRNQNDDLYQTIDYKEMPLYLLKNISIAGGESVEFDFGNQRLDVLHSAEYPDSVPTITKVKLKDAQGNVKKYQELYYSYFQSDPFIQYLPKLKFDNSVSPDVLFGTYNLKIGGSYVECTEANVYPSYFHDENPLWAKVNGQLQVIDNYFVMGGIYFYQRK